MSHGMRGSRLSVGIAAIAVALLSSGCCMTRFSNMSGGCGGCASANGIVADGGCDSCGLGESFPNSCGRCSTGACGGFSGMVLPLLSSKLACGSGCGDVYWNEWACDPPECCDPCDTYGCWVGPQNCYKPRFALSNVATCVGTSVSGAIGSVLNALGCGPCGYISGSCDATTIIDSGCGACGDASCNDCAYGGVGCGGCADGNCNDCASNMGVPEALTIEEPTHIPATMHPAHTASMTQQIRSRHGRSPHRLFSRRTR